MSKEEMNMGWSGYLKPLVRQSRFSMASTLNSVREWAGSNSSIASITGSMQNLLDPNKLMSMQEDAKTHKISSEIMKNSLYKSVSRPSRRNMVYRMSNSQTWVDSDPLSYENSWYPRMFQSMPPTPLASGRCTPCKDPSSKFSFRFLSRGATPRCSSPTKMFEEEDECQGLAGILKPRPRFIRAHTNTSLSDLSEGSEGQTGT